LTAVITRAGMAKATLREWRAESIRDPLPKSCSSSLAKNMKANWLSTASKLCSRNGSDSARPSCQSHVRRAADPQDDLLDRLIDLTLAEARMRRPLDELADGAAKVASVALEVGYASEAVFSRSFKKIAGMSPAAWRARSLLAAKSV